MARRHAALWALAAIALLAGCATWRMTPSLPSSNSLVLDQLVVFSDTPLPENHRLLEELRVQRSMLSTKLGLPLSDEPIHVYLFRSAEKLDGFMQIHYPEIPNRRAFFVETDTRLSVYAYWGDRVAEDLRHEVAHGYLHAVVPHLPLWLDEGLAEYFEVPRGQQGLNQPHVAQLNAEFGSLWRPNLPRLERLQSTREMSQTEYAESWAWVHFLLETTPERAMLLRNHLVALRKQPAPEPLSEQLRRMEPNAPQALVIYLQSLGGKTQ